MAIIDLLNSIWAIESKTLKQIQDIYVRHSAGIIPSEEYFETLRIQALGRKKTTKEGSHRRNIAVIDIVGVLAPKANLMINFSGGTSLQVVTQDFVDAIENKSVQGIILNVDSPGGPIAGIKELATIVFQSRGKKPIIAFSDDTAASGALWIAVAADEFYISSATVSIGSIGVAWNHIDISEQNKKNGKVITELASSPVKRLITENKPLSDEGKKDITEKLETLHNLFASDIKKFRNLDSEELGKVATGEIFLGEIAIKNKLVDGIKSFEQIVSEIDAPTKNVRGENVMKNKGDNGGGELEDEKYQKAVAEGIKKGKQEAVAEGIEKGKQDERKRIADIEAVSVPGYEDIIAEAKTDGVSTASDVTLKIVNAMQKEGISSSARRTEELEKNKVKGAAAPVVNPEDNGQELTLEQKAKKDFESSTALQSKYGNLDSYIGVLKYEEQKVSIKNKK